MGGRRGEEVIDGVTGERCSWNGTMSVLKVGQLVGGTWSVLIGTCDSVEDLKGKKLDIFGKKNWGIMIVLPLTFRWRNTQGSKLVAFANSVAFLVDCTCSEAVMSC